MVAMIVPFLILPWEGWERLLDYVVSLSISDLVLSHVQTNGFSDPTASQRVKNHPYNGKVHVPRVVLPSWAHLAVG